MRRAFFRVFVPRARVEMEEERLEKTVEPLERLLRFKMNICRGQSAFVVDVMQRGANLEESSQVRT